MVSMAAFQAVDPGSIPGLRNQIFFLQNWVLISIQVIKELNNVTMNWTK
jgi:hypothetical protein